MIYDSYSDEIKDFILFSCPFKIGDKIRIDTLHRGYQNIDEIIQHGVITDIQIVTKRQVAFRNGLGDIIKYMDKENEHILDEPVPEFTLTYTYKEQVPNTGTLLPWKAYKMSDEMTGSITIDCYGNNIQRASTVGKIIEKE